MTAHSADGFTGADILAACRELRPLIESAAAEIEEGRRLPAPVVEAMRSAGVFRMAMPRGWGGPETDPVTQVAIIEELSAQNGSVGWCAMIGSDSGYFAARLDEDEARRMYGRLDMVTGGAMRPSGRAVAVEGGYRVTGRWTFGSGCQHSDWMACGCFIFDGDDLRMGPSGYPTFLVCLVPGDACEVIDTWFTTGLRGSGSHDYAVTDLFVPENHTFNFEPGKPKQPGTLYRFPMMFLCNQAAVPLGIARAALEETLAIAARKTNMGGRPLREDSTTLAALAQEDARIGAARAHLEAVLSNLWETLVADGDPDIVQRARFRTAIVFVHEQCVAAVDRLYTVGGSDALKAGSVLDRCLRDIHTLNQHVIASPGTYANAGGMMLGQKPPPFY